MPKLKILLFTNTDWFMYNFNRMLASDLRTNGHTVVLMTPPGHYSLMFEKFGFEWIECPMNRSSLNPFDQIKTIFFIIKILRNQNFDIVHNFTLKCALLGSVAARFSNVKNVVNSLTGLGYVFTSSNFKARILRPIITRLLTVFLDKPTYRLVLLNEDDRNLFLKKRIVNQRIIRKISGAGVDCDKFKPNPTNNLNRKQPTVLLAARLLWDKGIVDFINSILLLKKRGVNARFILAGAPDYGNPAAIPKHKIEGWVEGGIIEYLGHVDDMCEIYKTVDICVLPSYREGLPTGLTEAAACALALVASDVPGCRDVIENEVDGLLFPPGNAQLLADAIGRLCSDSLLRKQLGEKAREKALDMFDVRIINRKTFEIYNEF